MKDLIFWLITFAAYFTYFCPPLACSEKRAARVTRLLLSSVLGGCIGYGLGKALVGIW